jgi:hypothetical protein
MDLGVALHALDSSASLYRHALLSCLIDQAALGATENDIDSNGHYPLIPVHLEVEGRAISARAKVSQDRL